MPDPLFPLFPCPMQNVKCVGVTPWVPGSPWVPVVGQLDLLPAPAPRLADAPVRVIAHLFVGVIRVCGLFEPFEAVVLVPGDLAPGVLDLLERAVAPVAVDAIMRLSSYCVASVSSFNWWLSPLFPPVIPRYSVPVIPRVSPHYQSMVSRDSSTGKQFHCPSLALRSR